MRILAVEDEKLLCDGIAEDLELDPDQVNVKATTEEHLGFTGTGEGMACHAVCLLQRAALRQP